MPRSEIFLNYRGTVDFDVIDSILEQLKNTHQFKVLNKIIAKRVYSITVECLENICKHSELKLTNNPAMMAHITVGRKNGTISINAGNTVTSYEKSDIITRLNHLNESDEYTLHQLYDEKLQSDQEGNDKCAGLGFIYMALKSGNKIIYSFEPLTNGYLYFEIQITLNQNLMRKLIIEQRSNSPKIIFDPENKKYLISGESRPPDVREFYEPVISWIEEYGTHLIAAEKKEPVTFDFNLDYFNSSSGKLILDMCKILAGLRSGGVNININWHSEKDDYDMLEAGREISRIVKFPFKFVEVENS